MEAGLVFQAEALLVTPKGSDFSITFWIYLTQVQSINSILYTVLTREWIFATAGTVY
jgi:hypothetical protein